MANECETDNGTTLESVLMRPNSKSLSVLHTTQTDRHIDRDETNAMPVKEQQSDLVRKKNMFLNKFMQFMDGDEI